MTFKFLKQPKVVIFLVRVNVRQKVIVIQTKYINYIPIHVLTYLLYKGQTKWQLTFQLTIIR